jgi:monothiol glutaredoxin
MGASAVTDEVQGSTRRKDMRAGIMDEISNEIAANTVVVYMKGTPSFPMCGFSAATVAVLHELGCPFASINILEDPDKREAIKAFSKWPTIPQVYIAGKFIGGCDIIQELHAAGELQQLVKDAFADHASVAASKH